MQTIILGTLPRGNNSYFSLFPKSSKGVKKSHKTTRFSQHRFVGKMITQENVSLEEATPRKLPASYFKELDTRCSELSSGIYCRVK
jgi:hypothetical protein